MTNSIIIIIIIIIINYAAYKQVRELLEDTYFRLCVMYQVILAPMAEGYNTPCLYYDSRKSEQSIK